MEFRNHILFDSLNGSSPWNRCRLLGEKSLWRLTPRVHGNSTESYLYSLKWQYQRTSPMLYDCLQPLEGYGNIRPTYRLKPWDGSWQWDSSFQGGLGTEMERHNTKQSSNKRYLRLSYQNITNPLITNLCSMCSLKHLTYLLSIAPCSDLLLKCVRLKI